MILAEEEAKTKWCPFARTPNYAGTTVSAINRNLHGEPLQTSLCIASQCMAWRWHWAATDKGYCGLAHNPIIHRTKESVGIET